MISTQAKTILTIQTIQIAAVIIAILVSPVSASTKAISVLTSVFFMGIGAYLCFYAINCMVYGNCELFAWIVVGIFLLFFVIAVMGSILGVAAAKNYQAQLNADWTSGLNTISIPQYGAYAAVATPVASVPIAPSTPPATPPAMPPPPPGPQ